ncbi:MAG TPA: hypothetical protein VGF68_20890, partial [Solirubrobacteraceae bacterium]
VGAHVPPDEVDEVRILGTWLASHPETPQLVLRPAPDRRTLSELWHTARCAAAPPPSGDPAAGSGGEGELHDGGVNLIGADRHL